MSYTSYLSATCNFTSSGGNMDYIETLRLFNLESLPLSPKGAVTANNQSYTGSTLDLPNSV